MDKVTGDDLMQIGDFSRLCRLSVRMLRHYQQRGLLQPAWVEPFTGYRFYAGAQLERAVRIRELRDVGLQIDQIAQALGFAPDSAKLVQLLRAHGDSLQAEEEAVQLRLAALERLINETKGFTMSFEITRRQIPARTIAALRGVIPDYGAEGQLWEQLMPLAAKAGIVLGPDTQVGANYYDEDFKETDCDVEVWLEVPAPFEVEAPLQCLQVPAHEVLSIVAKGSYDDVVYRATDALATYATENDLHLGNMYNLYMLGPGAGVPPSEYVTDIRFEVVPA